MTAYNYSSHSSQGDDQIETHTLNTNQIQIEPLLLISSPITIYQPLLQTHKYSNQVYGSTTLRLHSVSTGTQP